MSTSVETRIAALASRYTSIEKSIEELHKALKRITTSNDNNNNNNNNTATPAAAAAVSTSRYRDPCELKELQPCERDTPQVAALRQWCLKHHLYSAVFRWVPSDYYQHSLQWRRDILEANSIQHLCKSIVLENTHCIHKDCSHRENSRYYIIVYPYTEKFDAEFVMRCVKDMNEGLGKKKFNFRLADPEVSLHLTGFSHGAVAPFGTTTEIPVILSDRITQLSPPVFWMGGGHVDCKVRVDVEEFLEVVKPIVAAITTPLTAEELEHLVD
ncbi:YbaK/aminoacyl-tRNA synthetase-associated domain-containing protein [Trypanosoma theileri]|uniref:YbaK/aminoacyl-tRNA synthetase-associated domain-containing protein n=1 Tax=Trypanosoma theileri TaxID=67003 RepID=A0A1X0NXR2_9TRYP|nr:YbaK/aminoacyl-tRNA synthetase-associated domain-containing protein [Trypanosoma theileri]ORC89475.1 YbaK/aminoacyl-tRNA synthetase-associated domain-containing protein [Trypanosoma theileri]